MRTPEDAYQRLIGIRRETVLVESVAYLLEWDQETGLPAEGHAYRAEQLAFQASLAHEKITSPEVGELLAVCEGSPLTVDPQSPEAVNLRELRRQYDRKVKLPRALVEELARTAALAHSAWVEARRTSDFKLFRPWLEKTVALKREQAEALGYEESPYDALIDEFEPGERESHLAPLFDSLREGLAPLIEKIVGASEKPDTAVLNRAFPVERQRVFGEMAAAACGFDFRAGRLDEVVHPFCVTIGPRDIRITTRYDSLNFSQAFFGILHEAGHGMYEQGLDPRQFGTPMGEAVSLAVHESQSRLWENYIGRSRAFWEHFFPLARGVFHEALTGVEPESFLRAVNEVRPSLVRVEADEVTYNLHIILRFELERALISGLLKPADLPGAWNERFGKLIGLTVPDDSRGCLQDTHWASGLLGYFPTYCLGNLYAAQFFASALREIPNLALSISGGDFSPLLDWLRGKIHCHGKRFPAGELVRRVSGEPLSPRYFLDYLRSKYGELYKLSWS